MKSNERDDSNDNKEKNVTEKKKEVILSSLNSSVCPL